MDFTISIKEPSVYHNSWGIEIRSLVDRKPIDQCWLINNRIEKAAKAKNYWGAFHQGGSHRSDEPCHGWHYWEFLGLHGGTDADEVYRQQVEDFIAEVMLWLEGVL
jgi:hypothetical protein